MVWFEHYLWAPRTAKDYAHDPEWTDHDVVVDRRPGHGWSAAKGAAPGSRNPRAGFYQVRKLETMAAGLEPDSDEDDDATELPLWGATLRTGEEIWGRGERGGHPNDQIHFERNAKLHQCQLPNVKHLDAKHTSCTLTRVASVHVRLSVARPWLCRMSR